MDLPRAELRFHGLRAVTAAIARRRHRAGVWLRPRAAPLAITALATLCMLAGLDLIAHDFRNLRAQPAPRKTVIYLMSMRDPKTVIPVELAPTPSIPVTPASAPRCDVDVECFLPDVSPCTR